MLLVDFSYGEAFDLSLDGQEFPVTIVKIDREKLYGRRGDRGF